MNNECFRNVSPAERYSRKCGVTLVELILVVTIMGILSAMASVSFIKRANKDRVLSSGAQVAGFLRATITGAKQQQKAFSVEFGADSVKSYNAVDCSGGAGSFVRGVELSDQISFAARSGTDYTTIYAGTGLPSGTPSLTSSKYTSTAWFAKGNCMNLLNQVGSPVESEGFAILTLDNSADFAYIFLKLDEDNRMQEWLYENGVWVRQ